MLVTPVALDSQAKMALPVTLVDPAQLDLKANLAPLVTTADLVKTVFPAAQACPAKMDSPAHPVTLEPLVFPASPVRMVSPVVPALPVIPAVLARSVPLVKLDLPDTTALLVALVLLVQSDP